MHLLHTYPNTPELLTDLEPLTWTVRRADLQDEPTLPSTEQVWRLRDRLTETEMDAVVASYLSGTSMTQLTRQYGINHWSVSKLVRERSHRFRRAARTVLWEHRRRLLTRVPVPEPQMPRTTVRDGRQAPVLDATGLPRCFTHECSSMTLSGAQAQRSNIYSKGVSPVRSTLTVDSVAAQ